MVIISICGNIGSGKSTIINKLKAHGYCVYEEPISQMTEILENYYNDMHKWAFHLQLKVLKLYHDIKQEINQNTNKVFIIERSPYESKFVFAQSLYNQQILCKVEVELYNEFYNLLGWSPNHIIYLKTDPSICMNRIIKRNRDCESNISQDFIVQLHNLYTNLEQNNMNIVDGNQSIHETFMTIINIINSYT
uniref:Deoxynucleoside kinase domain-containing protein n=1 Tax=viral metagenome TaxID=1070528 RepID=A0A6C0F7K2_9ZZZZ|tara:strand:- start:2840 stop:3415 length:576 start_codon:yes stop_codon:yes gene_type:complete